MNSQTLKFRAWDVFNADMFYSDDLLDRFFSEVYKRRNGGNTVHVMQFTGLCDSDGVEIYEGDILRFGGEHRPITVNEEHGRRFMFGDNILYMSYAEDGQVIGHTYEKPKETRASKYKELRDALIAVQQWEASRPERYVIPTALKLQIQRALDD